MRCVGVAIALCWAAMCCCVRAQESQSPWSGNVALASSYVSRGFEQSWGRPALQAGVDYQHGSGWYAGTWASTVSRHFIEGASLEWDVSGGYAWERGAFGYRAGLAHYRYPGARMSATGTRYDYGEAVVAVDWRDWSASYALTVSRDYFGFNSDTLGIGEGLHSRGSGYLAVQRRFALGEGVDLRVHYGHQRVRNFSAYNWHDGKVALGRGFGGLDAELAYARAWNRSGVYRRYSTGVADGDGRVRVSDPIDGRFVLTLSRSF